MKYRPRQLTTHPENPVLLLRRVIDNATAIYTSVTTAVTVSMHAGISARERLAPRVGFCTLPTYNQYNENSIAAYEWGLTRH